MLAGFEPVDAHFALEATTGWRFVAEEIERAGFTAHLAEPAETGRARGPKRRAKTDRADCDHLSKLLIEGRQPQSWTPPKHILELRARMRLRKTLIDQRTEWQQRMHAQLFHQGVPPGFKLWSRAGRARLEDVERCQVIEGRAGRALVHDLKQQVGGEAERVGDHQVCLDRVFGPALKGPVVVGLPVLAVKGANLCLEASEPNRDGRLRLDLLAGCDHRLCHAPRQGLGGRRLVDGVYYCLSLWRVMSRRKHNGQSGFSFAALPRRLKGRLRGSAACLWL